MLKPKVKVVFSVLVFIGSGVIYFFGVRAGGEPAFAEGVARASGSILAQEAAKLIKPGGHLYVVARDPGQFKSSMGQAQLEAFKKGIETAHASIDSLEMIAVDPLRPLQPPPGDFFDLMRKAKPGSVVVSLMGAPVLTDDQWTKLGVLRTSIVAFCPGGIPSQSGLRDLMERQIVQLAVVDRAGIAAGEAPAPSVRGIFDQHYQLVTSANLGVLPAEPTGEPKAQ